MTHISSRVLLHTKLKRLLLVFFPVHPGRITGRTDNQSSGSLRTRLLFLICVVCMVGVVLPDISPAQDTPISDELIQSAPNVFIDCDRCDIDYIREQITYVNYV